MIGDYTETQHADMLARDRARAMAEAMHEYSRHMAVAVRASILHDDDESAARARAMAHESLHLFPALLAMVEPPEPEGVEAVTSLVERVGEWTGR